jgi:hypothetical protein
MGTPTELDRPPLEYGHSADHDYVELNEQQASQGFKTGHMRWVLGIGFALAGIGLGLTALLS